MINKSIIIYMDNKGVISLIKLTVYYKKSKHITIQYH